MQGSYRTARIVETRNLFLGRLRHCVWAVEQEDCNLLVGLLTDIHRPMNTGALHHGRCRFQHGYKGTCL